MEGVSGSVSKINPERLARFGHDPNTEQQVFFKKVHPVKGVSEVSIVDMSAAVQKDWVFIGAREVSEADEHNAFVALYHLLLGKSYGSDIFDRLADLSEMTCSVLKSGLLSILSEMGKGVESVDQRHCLWRCKSFIDKYFSYEMSELSRKGCEKVNLAVSEIATDMLRNFTEGASVGFGMTSLEQESCGESLVQFLRRENGDQISYFDGFWAAFPSHSMKLELWSGCECSWDSTSDHNYQLLRSGEVLHGEAAGSSSDMQFRNSCIRQLDAFLACSDGELKSSKLLSFIGEAVSPLGRLLNRQVENLHKQMSITVEEEIVDFLTHKFVPSKNAKYSNLKVVQNDKVLTVSVSAGWPGIQAQIPCNGDWVVVACGPDWLFELELAFDLGENYEGRVLNMMIKSE